MSKDKSELAREVEMVRKAADYTGLGNTYAKVSLDLLQRIQTALAASPTRPKDERIKELVEAAFREGYAEGERQNRYGVDDDWRTSDARASVAALANQKQESTECSSCHGLNTSCPIGCQRDPITGELNGS